MPYNTDIIIGKVYRMKPNAKISHMPEVVIVTNIVHGYAIEYSTFENFDAREHCADWIFSSRYFQITEDWHTEGIYDS